ncbi:LacI family DNA-binding transcriptional regulator [Alicyclobacillus kakegawensis]|uniref:LacI family DNA-binding transcriptional regulator n=1 Tax=Alicyclobacillus kakegawensis TaxID=392012 RepID=UPI0009FA5CD8|nr:LacI family DNA-binding transcriptional regulator [Alicyclobacillus kakegawensis]
MVPEGRADRPLTIRDIARMAGVSTATVSNVLNGTGRVAQSTIETVLSIMEDTNFKLNASARTLRQKTSRLIAILVPGFVMGTNSNPYYWEFVSGVSNVVDDEGFDVILKGISSLDDIRLVDERDIDGILIIGAFGFMEFVDAIIELGIPVVFVDSYLEGKAVNLVNLDDRYGTYLATQHVLALGHRKVLFASSKLIPGGVENERFYGYKEAMEASGLIVEPDCLIETDISFEAGRQLAHRLSDRSDYTAVVTTGDALALGLLRGFYECGLQVPRDVSVIGFDDLRQSPYAIPALSTVHQDVVQKGERAAQRLLRLMEEGTGQGTESIRLTPRLVVRESCAPPRA